MLLENFLRRLLHLYLQSYHEQRPLLLEILAWIARNASPFTYTATTASSEKPSLPMRAVVSTILSGKLYLSGITAASSSATLAEHGITHVLSVINADEVPKLPEGIRHRIIPISDTTTANILQHLPDVIEFIESAFQEDPNAKVLVHCIEGVSRSASAVIAYLMAERGMSFAQALRVVKRRRPVVSPNLGFVRQLSEWGTICEAKRKENPREWEQVLNLRQRRSESPPPPVRVEKVERRTSWKDMVFGRSAMDETESLDT
ncbi:protein-tyrosine phosphatase-like protein [Sphaerosporella brunnea]|uniref:protein-tyrosine-phosphatase n=1 Tax=Sphaerosporella brunnea TaxID=1250544 RepID=A0A5J5F4S1_9PEZI|nr:protein-tyrosine phosphatase-like protein [Sphaerosporella brunnea]